VDGILLRGIVQKESLHMLKTIRNFIDDESGATAIEYGLIAALVSVAAIAALSALGTALEDIFFRVQTELHDAAENAQPQ
jgi:pilus assembly protein Flp/PilA